MSCELYCPDFDLNGCDITPDWLLIIPQTYKMYYINSNDRQTFKNEFGIDIDFTTLDIDQCSTNGVQSLNFSVTFLNFNESSLKELLVICGVKRIESGASSHAITLFALIKQNSAEVTGMLCLDQFKSIVNI